MMGIYVVVGASVLGVISCMLIAWSLWSRSQARKRAEQRRLVSGQYAAIPPTSPAPMMTGMTGMTGMTAMTAMPPSATPSMFQPPAGHTVVAPPAGSPIPSMFHPPAGHTVAPPAASPIPSMFHPPAGHTVVAGPPGEFDDDEEEVRTEFMSSGQLFGHVEPPDEPTQFLTSADLFGVEEPEEVDEEEIATAFMSTDELFGRRTDATVVLSEDAIMPEPPAPAPTPAPRGPSRPAAVPLEPAPAPRYTGFVGDRADDRDDDDDLDDGDPETELVHQAELLRLITPSKRSE